MENNSLFHGISSIHKEIIICLIGESGSGKSTIASILEQTGFVNIDTYTTRKKRYEEETGHIFVNEHDKNKIAQMLVDNGKEDIAYISIFNDEMYWSTKDQYRGNGRSVYAFNPNGAEDLKRRVKDAEIVTVYVKCNENIRELRMRARIGFDGDTGQDFKYYQRDQINKRMESEKEEYNLLQCDYVIDTNNRIEDTVRSVGKLLKMIEEKIELSNKNAMIC